MTHPHQATPTHPLLGHQLGQVPGYPVQEAGARSLVNMVLDRKDNTWLQVGITISAANRLIGEVVQSQRMPPLGPSPG